MIGMKSQITSPANPIPSRKRLRRALLVGFGAVVALGDPPMGDRNGEGLRDGRYDLVNGKDPS
jgi:hypothetical protein